MTRSAFVARRGYHLAHLLRSTYEGAESWSSVDLGCHPPLRDSLDCARAGVPLGYRNFTAKVRYAKTFETVERSQTLLTATDDEIYEEAWKLVLSAWDGRRPLRLIGASLSNFKPNTQLALFDSNQKRNAEALHRALDGLHERFGGDAVMRGALLTRPDAQEVGPKKIRRTSER